MDLGAVAATHEVHQGAQRVSTSTALLILFLLDAEAFNVLNPDVCKRSKNSVNVRNSLITFTLNENC